MHTAVGLKEFRQNTATYIKRVQAGKSVVVYRHLTPLFKVSPVQADSWEEVIDFTKMKRGGIDIQTLLKRL